MLSLARFLLRLTAVFSMVTYSQGALSDKLVMAHYMPWYSTKDISGQWGWHWTMNHFDPDRIQWDGKREAASHDYPLIGLYDSGDDHALECQVLLMKFTGLDGVIIDWYGIADHLDFSSNHRHTQQLVPWLKKAGLRFAICYEDKSVEQLVQGKNLTPKEGANQAEQDLLWVQRHWFSDPSYVQVNQRPMLLVFGPQYLEKDTWLSLQKGLSSKPVIFGLPHLANKHGIEGVFGWPPVAGGKPTPEPQWKTQIEDFHALAKKGVPIVATAFPGFQDIYKQAGLHDSYGSIAARLGSTLADSLESAGCSLSPVVQIATWNDYGEGTMIEPTRKHGYRYLELLQQRLPKKALGPSDLRLPVMLFQLRKRCGSDEALKLQLNKASDLLFASKCTEAEMVLASVATVLGRRAATFPETPNVHREDYRLVSDILYREEANLSGQMHQRCRLDVYFPAKSPKFPTVVWFHGGGMTMGERSIPIQLREKGIGVVAVNYRLCPNVKSPAFLEDAAAAVAWTFKHISNYGGDIDKIFVSGHSAGAYLSLMLGMDKRWLSPHGIDPKQIAGLIPLSPQVITHFAIREERGIDEKQPIVDEMAPLFHIDKNVPPCLLVTGDREKELMGRYEENAYFWRMMKVAGHKDVSLMELQGFDHGKMPEPAMPLLLRFVEKHSGRATEN